MNNNENQFSFKSIKPTLLTIILFTGMHWTVLAFGIPVLDSLPYWKYKLLSTPLSPGWILAVVAAFSLAWMVHLSRMKPGMKILLFILLGTMIQYGFAFAKGQGLDGIREHMVSFGHAEFAKASVEQPGDMLWVAQHYEEVAAKLKYGYVDSKPPGTLFFYMMWEAISSAIHHKVDRLENLRTLASLTWPPFSYLVLIPLYFLSREITKDSRGAMLACLFYLSIPSVTLITLHTDQTLYPLLAALPTLCCFVAYRKDSFWLAVLCGALLYFAVYFSFGLAVVGLFFLAPIPAFKDDSIPVVKRFSIYASGIITGGLLLHIPAVIFLKYHISQRYANAWANHIAWKGWENTPATYLTAGTTDVIEFSVWIGLPLVVCFIACLTEAFRALRVRKIDVSGYFNLTLTGIFIYLLAFGKTKAEVARLWLFLVPFVCISVSQFIRSQEWFPRAKTLFAAAILLLEVGTTFFTLRFQDFS